MYAIVFFSSLLYCTSTRDIYSLYTVYTRDTYVLAQIESNRKEKNFYYDTSV